MKFICAFAMMLATTPVMAQQAENPWSSDRAGHQSHTLDIRPKSQILAEAQRYVGSGNVTGFRGPWCAAFAGMVARRAGYRVAASDRRAIDALRWGTRVSHPQPGDLVVSRHHVTIFAGWSSDGRLIGLGGNQGRRVRYSHYSPNRVIAYVRL